MASIKMNTKLVAAQVAVILALIGGVWFYYHKALNLALTVDRITIEIALIQQSKTALLEAWAMEATMREGDEEKTRHAQQALSQIDTHWGTLTVHDTAMVVLQSIGAFGNDTTASDSADHPPNHVDGKTGDKR